MMIFLHFMFHRYASLKQPCKMNPVHTKKLKIKECNERFSFDITTDDLAAF